MKSQGGTGGGGGRYQIGGPRVGWWSFFFGKTDFQVGIDTKSRGGVQNFEKFLSKI